MLPRGLPEQCRLFATELPHHDPFLSTVIHLEARSLTQSGVSLRPPLLHPHPFLWLAMLTPGLPEQCLLLATELPHHDPFVSTVIHLQARSLTERGEPPLHPLLHP